MEELVIKYLSGNASPEEIRELEAWVLADAENKKQFMAIKKAWMLTGAARDERQTDVEKRWQETSEILFGKSKIRPLASTRKSVPWYAIAAAVVGLILIGIWLLNRENHSPKTYIATDSPREVQLPDGSRVFMNKNTSITFSPKDASGNRALSMDGVAFFDVKRDVSRPFEVSTPSIRVRVLGTSFLVDAQKEKAEVLVKSGRVRVSLPGVDSLDLTANEGASFKQEAQSLKKIKQIDPNYLSFVNDSLVFDNTALDQVVRTLSRHFEVDISLENEELKNCLFVGTFTNESLEEILRLMKFSLGIEYRKNGSTYLISGSCK